MYACLQEFFLGLSFLGVGYTEIWANCTMLDCISYTELTVLLLRIYG